LQLVEPSAIIVVREYRTHTTGKEKPMYVKPNAPFYITYFGGDAQPFVRTTSEQETYLQVRLTLPVACVPYITKARLAEMRSQVATAVRKTGYEVVVEATFGYLETMQVTTNLVHGSPCTVLRTRWDDSEVMTDEIGVIEPREDLTRFILGATEDALRNILSREVFYSLYREINGSHASVPLTLLDAAKERLAAR